MIGRASNFLGLAFSDRGIACAEVAVTGDRRTVRRVATFTFTAELTLEAADATGAALAAFLREKRFSASRVVAGMPARWLIAAEKEIPPANETQARAALQMQAERIGSGDGGDIVFDYAGKPDPAAASRVLLVGIVKHQFERVRRILDVAGLNVAAITSTGLALAGQLMPDDRDAAMLLVGAAGAEMVLRQAGTSRTLRHVSMNTNGNGLPAVGPLGAELRRAMAIGNAPAREMLLLDGLGLGPEQVSELSLRSGVQIRAGDEMKLLGLSSETLNAARSAGDDPHPPGFFAPSISLALAAAGSEKLPVDFSRSRLAVADTRLIGRNAIIGIVVGALAIIGIGFLYWQVHGAQNEVDAITAQIKQLEERSKPAQLLVERVTYARSYFDLRPPMLDCLREFTMTFHDDEKIWVTSFVIHDNGKGTLTGKTLDQNTALGMVDRLKKNKKFSAVERLDVHEADARTHEWQFSFNFTYNFAG